MSAYVLARDIRETFLVTIRLVIQYQQTFCLLSLSTETSASHVQTQLQRHIEARKPMVGIELNARNIVDAETGFTNHPGKFFDPNIS